MFDVQFKSGRTVTIHPTVRGDVKPRLRTRGLGDWTEHLLKKAGITEDRYKAAKEALGMAPTCNCAKRKAWLNKVSEWWTKEAPPINQSPDADPK